MGISPGYFENKTRGSIIEVHISDLHFGAIDGETIYNILREQFLNKISLLRYDILSINGDIFDHGFMSSSDTIYWTMRFIDECIQDVVLKQATMIIIEGTRSHDAGQLKIFYQYLNNPNLDLRIIESGQIIYAKKARILCIPEEYGKGEEYYKNLLFYNGEYDTCFMHGTIKGSVYGADKEDLDSPKSPVFSLESFKACRGPIIAGHVHDPGCFSTYMYYCGSPIRWKFGEESDKGFLVVLHNLDTQQHYAHFERIESFRYDTVNLDYMAKSDPKVIIDYLKSLKESGIYKIRVQFTSYPEDNYNILKNYFKTDSSVVLDYNPNKQAKEEILKASNQIFEKYQGLDFLLDAELSDNEKFVKYVNFYEGDGFITVNEMLELMKDI